MNRSTERLTETRDDHPIRWSTSTMVTVTSTPDVEKTKRGVPPIPPIPTEEEDFAWRRRHSKRCSYTSHMSGRSGAIKPQSFGADAEIKSVRPKSVLSTTSALRPSTSRLDLGAYGRSGHDVHAKLHWDINALNPRNWNSKTKWLHTLIAGMAFHPTSQSLQCSEPSQLASPLSSLWRRPSLL